MTIAELIADIRIELTDKESSRWTDADLLSFTKKAARRLQHILFRNDIQVGKALTSISVESGVSAYALPVDFATDIGLYRDDGLKLEKLTDDRYFGATSGSECVAYYLLGDQVRLYAAPSGARTLSLLYWPRVDVATSQDTPASEWTDDGVTTWQPWGSAWTTASDTPYGGRFDDLLGGYVIFACKNADEMNVDEEKAMLADMENNVLSTYGTVAPTIVRQRGWLP